MKKAFLIILSLIFSLNSKANEIEISLDNDILTDSDRHYTHGTKVSYVKETKTYNHFILNGKVDMVKYSIGQYIYTPSDIKVKKLIINDRPYGGILYFDRKEYIRKTKDILEEFSILVGIIGPHSYSEQSQTEVHKLINDTIPQGWDNQLKDELALNFQYQYNKRYYKNDFFDYVNSSTIAIGNVNTHISFDYTLRFGYNLGDSFHESKMEPIPKNNKNLSIYLFFCNEFRLVYRNVFLDGNMFRDSHSVEKNNLITDFTCGLVFSCYNIKVKYGIVRRSKEFKEQKEPSNYGSISVTYKW